MDDGPIPKPYSDTDLKDFLHARVLAKCDAANKRARRAYRSEIDERVRNGTGYDRHLAARIKNYLRRVYPETIELPEHLTGGLSYPSTLYELLQREHIEFPWGGNIAKTIGGKLDEVNSNIVALTAKGHAAIQRERVKRITVGAAIITALSTGIVAVVTLIQYTSSP